MIDPFGKGYIWPSTTGTATDPTTSFVASSAELAIGDECELHCHLAVSGAAAVAVQLKVEVSFDGKTTYEHYITKTIPGAAIGAYPLKLSLPPDCHAKVSAKRWGGSASTKLSGYAYARRPSGEPARDGQPLELAPHQSAGIVCWSDGAGAADTLTTSYDTGPNSPAAAVWIPVGEATELEITATLTSGPSTKLYLEVKQSMDAGSSGPIPPAVDTVSGGVVTQTIAQEELSGANGTFVTRRIHVSPGGAVNVLAKCSGTASDLIAVARLFKV